MLALSRVYAGSSTTFEKPREYRVDVGHADAARQAIEHAREAEQRVDAVDVLRDAAFLPRVVVEGIEHHDRADGAAEGERRIHALQIACDLRS